MSCLRCEGAGFDTGERDGAFGLERRVGLCSVSLDAKSRWKVSVKATGTSKD
jgi:hypothetical protein